MRVRCDWQVFAFSESVFIRRKWWRIYACTIHQVNISKSMLDSFSFVVSKLNFPLDSDKIHFFPFLCSSRLVPIRDKSSWISWRFLSTLRTKYFCRSFDNRERISCYTTIHHCRVSCLEKNSNLKSTNGMCVYESRYP